MSEFQYIRNREMLKLKRSGVSYKQLANDFGITTTRVRQICEETRAKEKQPIADIFEIKQAINMYDAPDRLYSLIIHELYEHGYLRYNRWKTMTEEQILDLPHLGKRCVKIILKAQEMQRS